MSAPLGYADPAARDLPSGSEASVAPEEALLASPGCGGDPAALADLGLGGTVLVAGSGGGAGVLLSGRRAGPEGKAYGLGRTGKMLALANANKAKAGVENVELLRGAIGNIPLPDDPVGVII